MALSAHELILASSDATACSQASLLVTKVLVAHDKDAIAGVVDVYAAIFIQEYPTSLQLLARRDTPVIPLGEKRRLHMALSVLVAHDKDAIAGVVDVYAATRKDQLMSTKCHVQPSFFSEWNNWCVSASKQLK
jgi:hypothetical protein